MEGIVAPSKDDLLLERVDSGDWATITLRRRGSNDFILHFMAPRSEAYDLELIGREITEGETDGR
jgi:hypothetical protein